MEFSLFFIRFWENIMANTRKCSEKKCERKHSYFDSGKKKNNQKEKVECYAQLPIRDTRTLCGEFDFSHSQLFQNVKIIWFWGSERKKTTKIE